MAITPEEVRRIAELARLEVPAEREGRMVAELSAVLEFVATLDRLDLAGCESTSMTPALANLNPGWKMARRLGMAVLTMAAATVQGPRSGTTI